MAYTFRKVSALAVVVLAVGALQLVSATPSFAAGGATTCNGGSIAAGSYSSLLIRGVCSVNAGSVNVAHGVTVSPGATLLAAFGGSDLTVGQNLTVGKDGVLVLGCEPTFFVCFNDPDQADGTLTTHHHIGLNLVTNGALAVIVHATTIGLNGIVSGGGGGVSCANTIPSVPGSPPYIDFEDNTFGLNAIVQGVQSCWAGFIRNHVHLNVIYLHNTFADPDASELVTNTVGLNMICLNNSPPVQVGDSHGSPDVVGGHAIGECKNVAA